MWVPGPPVFRPGQLDCCSPAWCQGNTEEAQVWGKAVGKGQLGFGLAVL